MDICTQNRRHRSGATRRAQGPWQILALAVGLWAVVAVPTPTAATPPGSTPFPAVTSLTDLGFDPEESPGVEVTLGTAELTAAAVAARQADPRLAALLGSVTAFHLQQFAPPTTATVAAANDLLAALADAGWELAQLDTQGTRSVTVHIHSGAHGVEGLVVVAIDPGREVTLASVTGDITPAQLISFGLAVHP